MIISKVIQHAFQLINVDAVGEDMPAENATIGLECLNMMLDQWSLERLMVYYVKNDIFSLTSGVGVYTIGPAVQVVTFGPGTYTAGNAYITINGHTITTPFRSDITTTFTDMGTAITTTLVDICTVHVASIYHGATLTCTPTGAQPLTITIDLSAITGTLPYTIAQASSPANLLNSTRPIKITKSFIRDSTNANSILDLPMEIIDNNQYQDIMLKGLQSTYPRFLNYVPTYPDGQITLWPLPNYLSLSLGLSQTMHLADVHNVSDTFSFPPGYAAAIAYNLALELAPRFNYEIKPVTVSLATNYKANIKRVNSEKSVSVIDYPTSGGRRSFNIYAGR